MKGKTNYSKRVWLNDEGSPSTGNVVAYDGIPEFEEGPWHSTFLKISDCHNTVKLHKAEYDTMKDFVDKMEKLRNTVDEFIAHLKAEYITKVKKKH